jgi:RNA polymerase sigma factor (TIGR02999 family)
MQDDSAPADVTLLLREWQHGSRPALERLIPLVYAELHTLASRYMSRERPGHTLQTTALINEAYVKLVGQRQVDWQNRAHFFGIAAQVMRRILVDHARHDGRLKRGGDAPRIPIQEVNPASAQPPINAVDAYALDRALTRLEALDPHQGRIVELRFFGGLTIDETAAVMNISAGTVKREWGVAKAWLYRELTGDTPSSPSATEE